MAAMQTGCRQRSENSMAVCCTPTTGFGPHSGTWFSRSKTHPAKGVTTELVSAGFSQVGTDGEPLFLALLTLIFKPLTD